ncbi:MAG: alkylated DNA repair dioxygenase [Hyphomicrobiales bacterium]|nr:MAG: alkylated DNA repair dioxygenase [Hyphomicrobiales bacterium]
MDIGGGYHYFPGFLDRDAQRGLLALIRAVLASAPLYTPLMPGSGRPMSVRMSNCGPWGWVTDRERGYRYQRRHPETGEKWPPMPGAIAALWAELCAYPAMAESCLINYYGARARMGLHRDQDEEDFSAPILSISLGDEALFRMGGPARKDPTRSLRLVSGDLVLMTGAARSSYHGIDRIVPGSSALLEEGGRFNLTCRRVHGPDWQHEVPR